MKVVDSLDRHFAENLIDVNTLFIHDLRDDADNSEQTVQ
jgi:hypothetical protein